MNFDEMRKRIQGSVYLTPARTGGVKVPILGEPFFKIPDSWLSPPGHKYSSIFVDEMDNFKENDMISNQSATALFCDGCRKAFPTDEVFFMNIDATKTNRSREPMLKDKAGEFCLCTGCYMKFRDAVEPFNIPFVQWSKDEDE